MLWLDAIVCGSVAVRRDGRRCGKGEGYSDLEFAILRELGQPPVPVATSRRALRSLAADRGSGDMISPCWLSCRPLSVIDQDVERTPSRFENANFR